MKKIMVIMCLLLASLLIAQNKNSDAVNDKIKGTVKTRTTYFFNYYTNAGVDNLKFEKKLIDTYDTTGNLTVSYKYAPDNTFTKKVYEYNKNGYKSKIVEFMGNTSEIFGIEQYKNDNNGNAIEVISLNPDTKDMLLKTTNKYDKSGLIEKNMFLSNNKILQKVLYKNDATGNETERQVFNNKNELTNTVQISYTKENDFIIEKTMIPDKEGANMGERYTYDDHGNLFSREIFYLTSGKKSTKEEFYYTYY